MGHLEVVAGGQFGSEGKGAIAAWRSQPEQSGTNLVAVRVAGPNAGHTVIGSEGTDTSGLPGQANLCEPVLAGGSRIDYEDHPPSGARFAWRLRSVPVAAVVNPSALLLIASGSEIDLPVLLNEIRALDAAGYQVSDRLLVDAEATLISQEHKDQERFGLEDWYLTGGTSDSGGLSTTIGSTGKGIGAARAERIWRVPGIRIGDSDEAVNALRDLDVGVADTSGTLNSYLRQPGGRILIEGTQGYGLGLHAGFYPYCTSSDCRAIDFLAMAGISPWLVSSTRHGGFGEPDVVSEHPSMDVWLCLRPYPIRVGGNSGPLANETTWEQLGLPTEHTTVTGKVRRVGHWDGGLARKAIAANGGPGGVKIAVTMLDTIVPEIAGWTGLPEESEPADAEFRMDPAALKASTRLREEVTWLSRECQQPIAAVGTGPDTVLDLRDL